MEMKSVSLFTPDLAQIYQLQKTSFPPREQYAFPILLFLASGKHTFYRYSGNGGAVDGIMFYTQTARSVYLLYLAVRKDSRRMGMGSRFLAWLKENAGGRSIYLNIDPITEHVKDSEIRRQRMSFYRKNGFLDTGIIMSDSSGSYQILSSDGSFDEKEYRKAINRLGMWIYHPVFLKPTDLTKNQ